MFVCTCARVACASLLLLVLDVLFVAGWLSTLLLSSGLARFLLLLYDIPILARGPALDVAATTNAHGQKITRAVLCSVLRDGKYLASMCRYMYFVYRDDLVDTLKHGHKRWCAAHDGVTLPYSNLSTSSPMARLLVRPGLSMPSRFTHPA